MLTLNWHPIVKWDSITQIENVPVVYILCIKNKNSYIPYYVGKSEKYKVRLFEHLFKLMGGAYTIFHKDYLNEFVKYKDQKDNHPIIHYPDATNIVRFINENESIKLHLDYMLDNLYYTFCEIDKELLVNIEKAVISKIGKSNLMNTRCGEYTLECEVEFNLSKLFPYLNYYMV